MKFVSVAILVLPGFRFPFLVYVLSIHLGERYQLIKRVEISLDACYFVKEGQEVPLIQLLTTGVPAISPPWHDFKLYFFPHGKAKRHIRLIKAL